MTASDSVQSAAPDELEVRLARLGLPAAGAQDRQAALPGPLQAFHRALLGAFLTDAGPPDLTVVGQLAAELALDPQAALAALATADLVHIDPAAGHVRVAYPFSGASTAHRVELADGPTVSAMCALDALGIPQMTRRTGRIDSADPTTGQPITIEVDDQGWRWRPATTVVLAGMATLGDACGSVADCCCPYQLPRQPPRRRHLPPGASGHDRRGARPGRGRGGRQADLRWPAPCRVRRRPGWILLDVVHGNGRHATGRGERNGSY